MVSKKGKEDTNPLQYLANIRQNQSSVQKQVLSKADGFVVDFLSIWDAIHSEAPNLALADIKKYSKDILDTITLPFYEKHKNKITLEKYDAWLNEYSSVVINWVGRGRIMFPLRLITYEIVNHSDRLLEFYLEKLQTKEIKGTTENLFSFLFPRLINVAIPLNEVDLLILKSLQALQNESKDLFKGASRDDISRFTNASTRTIVRRIQNIRFFQISIPIHFLDMAKLGYETFLLSHFKPIPDQLKPYALNSVDLSVSQFSLFQVPTTKTKVYMQLQDDLEPTLFHKMEHRIHSWNLTGLTVGKDGWRIPPHFIYCEPKTQSISPSPTIDTSLLPEIDTFRKLTPADIKILEFITTKGATKNKKELSRSVKVSLPETSQRLDEYNTNNLIFKVHQFFNLGLDLSISFFIVSPNSYEIPWIQQLLTFPGVDAFYSTDQTSSSFFGHIKLPNKWFKGFTRKITRLKNEFPELRIYYTAEVPSIPKWNLSLAETYF